MRKTFFFKIILLFGIMFSGILLLLLLFVACMGGGAESNLYIPASDETVAAYQEICSETGIPWDIVLMADVLLAEQLGQRIEDREPLITSLQFCILTVTEQEAYEEEIIENGQKYQVTRWKDVDQKIYEGADEICEYLNITESWFSGKSIQDILNALEEKREEDQDEDTDYIQVLTVNEDYEDVLRNRIGLTDKNRDTVLSMHNSQYLAQVYGYVYGFDEIELPELVVGDVTRHELAQVAVSLLGHPYLMGGKSPAQGAPKGPLDCSGFVDWVYIQCFGTGVSGGGVPEGVAVSGTALQWYATTPVSISNLQIGDLAFLQDPAKLGKGKINHVGIYIGEYNGAKYFIHCAGRAYGTEDLPNGRVGISRLRGSNDYNPVTGGHFSPAMKGCNFRYFRRPNFAFRED